MQNQNENNKPNFGIRAEVRGTKKRVIIHRGMTEEEAKAWVASPIEKKNYRYFRAVNLDNYKD